MDEQIIELFENMNETLTALAELQMIEMLASDKYTINVKAVLVQMLVSIHGGNLPMDLSEITGKDETELLEMMMSNDGDNSGSDDGVIIT